MTAPTTAKPRLKGIRDSIRGVVPVLPTPFTAAGGIDLRSFARETTATLDLDVSAVMFPGFASEYATLTWAERLELMDLLLGLAGERNVTVLASVTDAATEVAIDRARAYVARGAAALNVLPQAGPCPPAQVIDHWCRVADAVAPAPVVLQYVPDLLGSTLTADELRTVVQRCPNVVAVKVESRPARVLVSDLATGHAPVPGLVGNGGLQLTSSLAAGAIGVQPGGGFVEIYVEILRRWDSGDRIAATHLYRALLHYLIEWQVGPTTLTQVGKIVSWRRGLADTPVCRRPVAPLDPAALASIDAFLEEFAPLLEGSA